MKSAFWKDTFREIWKTKNRFISIFAIIAIGVGFFAGVKASSTDMKLSEDAYYVKNNLMDVQVISTLGFGENDITAFRQLDGIRGVLPSYSADLYIDQSGNQSVCKVYSLPPSDVTEQDNINQLTVVDGRLPENESECVIDSYLAELKGFSIGDTVQMKTEEGEEISSVLTREDFTIVGIVKSPMFIYKMQRGTSTIGSGAADGFVYLMPQAFAYEDYTTVFLTFESAQKAQAYTDEYDRLREDYVDAVETVGDTRKTDRLEEIKEEANQTIAENEKKLEDAKTEAETGFADGEQQLADAKAELEAGEAEYTQQKQLFDSKMAEAEQQLADSKDQTEAGWTQYNANLKEVSDGLAELSSKRQELITTRTQLNAAKQQVEDGKEQLDAAANTLKEKQQEYQQGLTDYQNALALLESTNKALENPSAVSSEQIESIRSGLNQLQSGLGDLFFACISGNTALRPQLDTALEKISSTLASQKEELDEASTELQKAQTELDQKQKEWEAGKTEYEQGEAAYQSGMQQLEAAQKELDDASVQLLAVQKQLKEADQAIVQGEQELVSQREEGEKQLEEAREKLDTGWTEYQDGVTKLDEEKQQAQQKITDAETELADAKQQLEELEEPTWCVLDRTQACPGYSSLEEDAGRVDNIAKVFPVFFLLVAALVCLTTMTRMIEEERTEIGTLKALGYSNGSIIMKYMTYGVIASILGSVVGMLIGFQLFPRIIMNGYGIMYDFPVIKAPFQLLLAIPSMIAAALCVIITVYAVCRGELVQHPSQLMRPKAPKPGKRVLLERIPAIWNKLNFSHKVTARNLFRYKQRIIMTVVGIAGCTALMLTGFALKDSIMEIVDKQFTEISLYDMMIVPEENEIDKTVQVVGEQSSIGAYGKFLQETMTAKAGTKEIEVYLNVPEQTETFSTFIDLHTLKGKEPISLQEDSVVITEKFADQLGLSKGDVFTLSGSDYQDVELTVGAIAENYTYHYVYMTPETFEKVYGQQPEYNLVLADWKDDDHADTEGVFSALSDQKAMQGISFLNTVKESFTDMISSLNYVVLVLIISAGLLAFVVLYNLTNINVNERIREIATLKVLGFYDQEVSAYIYRENVILTILGTGVGLILGIFFSRFVISTAEMDIVRFGRDIKALSYVMAAALTLLFAIFVNVVMHFRLKKVKMVESLKSVE